MNVTTQPHEGTPVEDDMEGPSQLHPRKSTETCSSKHSCDIIEPSSPKRPCTHMESSTPPGGDDAEGSSSQDPSDSVATLSSPSAGSDAEHVRCQDPHDGVEAPSTPPSGDNEGVPSKDPDDSVKTHPSQPAGSDAEGVPSIEAPSAKPVDAAMQESSTEDALYPNQAFLCQRQEYQAMMQYHYTRYNTHSPGLVSRDSVRHQLFHLWMRVHIWVELWVAPDAASRLSADDKREIIASLNGFCVQEGWDSIHRRLPPTARIEMAKVVAETMINQFICTKFLDNSFWFMDAKLHATDRNGDAHFPQRFQYLYERLKAVEPMDAAWLKTLTVQKCNELSFFGSPPPPTQLARHTAAHRTALLRSYGNELLERRVFQLLLKDEPRKAQRTQRDQALRSLLEHAAQEMIEADGGLYANLVVERLSDLPRTFQHGSDRTRLHGFHLGAMPGDGGRILMVTRPGIVFTDMQSLSHWNQLPPWRANAAEVLVAAKGKKAQAEWLAITTTTTNTASHAEDDEEDAEEDEEDDVEDAEDGDPVQEETYESGTSPE